MFSNRLKKLQKILVSKNVDALLVSSAANIFYLTGIDSFSEIEREAYLFVARGTLAMLFTDGRYIEGVKNKSPKDVHVFQRTDLFNKIKSSKVKKIGIEQNFTVAELKRFKKETSLNFTLVKPLIEPLRAVKDAEEIKNIKLACSLTDKCYSNVLKNIGTNITEKEIAWKIEKFIKENGGELAFDLIIAFGPNSAVPHHKTGGKRLATGDELILLDFGAKVNGYCSDMTRTLLTKNASNRAHNVYEAVLESQKRAVEFINTSGVGLDSPEVAKIANDFLVSKGFEPIPHGLGHGIGIEVHELPHLSPKSQPKAGPPLAEKDVLKPGMVFTIEPGIYIPGFGGIRIEDDFLLSEKLEE